MGGGGGSRNPFQLEEDPMMKLDGPEEKPKTKSKTKTKSSIPVKPSGRKKKS